MLFFTILVTVSVFALEVSVAGLVVSTFTAVSVVVFMDVDESILAESVLLPYLLPLQASRDNEMAKATTESLNAFFMMMI